MKTLDEPPYLTVGTDVSAKYRGAFCEAKIKTAKRLVKAKVTFKPDLSTAEVHDENIKGPLKTLDRLPLTNPEHFGTPVIGKKGNRGRRSNPVQEEELSSSSSEEEESNKRQNEDLFGKVVCVEGVATGEKKKTTWYPALVISPDCHDDVTVKKDNIFVRSFKDGKFYTVLRKDVREMNSDFPPKADAGLKPALDAALEFLQQFVVPSSWKTEVKEESSSSEDEDEEEEEGQDEDASGEDEEEEVEPFPEERENFLQQLYKFMEDRGTPINKRPVLGYRNLNLFKLYRLVHKLGGFEKIESGSIWKQVYQNLGIPVLNSAAGYNVKCAYRKYLNGFEEYCTSTAITFRMDLPLKQAPKVEVKSEGQAGGAPVTSSSSEEQKVPVDGDPCSTQSLVCKDEKPDLSRTKTEPEPLITEEKDSGDDDEDNDDNDDNDENDDNEDLDPEEEGPLKGDADEGSSTARLGAENIKEERDEEPESKDNSGDDSSQEGEEGEEFECYPPGMKVQVRYGRARNLKTYEATVKEADVEGGEVLYLVHYCGWNVRYDEWIKADKIVRPANKNVPKIKHRKKIKNKAERERDRLERLNDREVLGPSPHANRLPRSKCGLSQDVFSKMDEGEDKGTQQSPVKSIEITSILNGLQEPPQTSECLESGSPPEASKPSPGSGKSQESGVGSESADVGKRRSQPEFEGEQSNRKRKSDGAAERTPKGHSKAKTRSTRSADWLPGASPRKMEERAACPGEERGASSSSSSDDEDASLAESQAEESERSRPKPKGSSSKKYNGMKEKTKGGRPAGFWEIPEKRAKMAGNAEERPAVRSKGQKDVWSSIQAQWPKQTLKELFSDSDTEAANSPPPPAPPCLEEPSAEQDAGPEDEASEEQMENDKLQEFPSSGTVSSPPANSSDSEDQSVVEGAAKSTASKNSPPQVKAATSPKCHVRSPPSSHKYHKQGDADHGQHRDHHGRSSRVYKWSFQMADLEKMSSLERISFLQEKLQDIRNHYLSLKSEVASIDRRRKRMKKKERESTVAASSSSSSSSSPSSSSLTAAVMLTLADPPVSSSSSSSQNSGVSVECR
ncbi:AT-rich interactive domain-containing protein 4B [Liparis tanakae]|uniref:AT-rich interactive domain-containing protein 4B n=1 Tax=Liparis tanakae TaxID=230148 RepID=A0A4Z2H9W7_9TELE|nr:AT-rich interactive domain-containing protein 4B [Liparis tanakae]